MMHTWFISRCNETNWLQQHQSPHGRVPVIKITINRFIRSRTVYKANGKFGYGMSSYESNLLLVMDWHDHKNIFRAVYWSKKPKRIKTTSTPHLDQFFWYFWWFSTIFLLYWIHLHLKHRMLKKNIHIVLKFTYHHLIHLCISLFTSNQTHFSTKTCKKNKKRKTLFNKTFNDDYHLKAWQ